MLLKNKIDFSRYINGLSALQFFHLFRYATLMLIGIIFAKSGLSAHAIGNYETLMFIASLVTTFWVSGIIKTMLSRYDKKKDDHLQSPFFFNVFLFISAISILCFFLLQIFGNQINRQLSSEGYIPYYNLIAWYVLLSNPSFLIEYILLLKNKASAIIKYGIITSLAQLIAVTLPILMGYSLFYSLCGLILIAIIKLFLLLYILQKYSAFKPNPAFILQHSQLALPIIISHLFSCSAEFIDGFIISSNYDSAGFAIFRYGARELPLTLLLANTLSNTMIAEISNADKLDSALTLIRERSLKLMYVLFPLTFLLLVTSHYIYPVIFNINFSESATIFNVYLLLITSRLIFPQTILTGLKKTNDLLWTAIAELIVNILLSIILLDYFGMTGVAIGTVIAYMIEKIIMILILKKNLQISAHSYIPMKQYITFSICIIIAFIIVETKF
jgi:O-antigen/teichoic acid export membrane protein